MKVSKAHDAVNGKPVLLVADGDQQYEVWDDVVERVTVIHGLKKYTDMNAPADAILRDRILAACAAYLNNASLPWPDAPGWYWAYGRIAGMREPALMSARALLEGDKLIVYIGEAMTHRLSLPDPELPLKFKLAVLPDF